MSCHIDDRSYPQAILFTEKSPAFCKLVAGSWLPEMMLSSIASGIAPPAVGSSRHRFIALDGLRGLAALVVVFHHIYMIARPFIEPKTNAWAVGSLWWFVSETPIKLLTAGTESVLVFFVLSGLVVPLPLIGKNWRAWVRYYPARMVRLYVPVWASLILAGLLINVVPHPVSAVQSGSWTERSNSTAASLGLLFSEAGLARKSFSSNSVLWSLSWEVVFSLALPMFLLLAYRLRRFWIPAVLACLLLITAAKLIDNTPLEYLPIFFIGTLVAVNLERLTELGMRLHSSRRGLVGGWVLLVTSALLIVLSWMLRPVLHAGTPLSDAIGTLAVVGALGLVACGVIFDPLIQALGHRIPQWLGRISFSLYLTHLPILVTLAYVFGDANWALVALVGTPTVLVVATLFARFVEQPSHRLSKRIGGLTDLGFRRATIRLRARHVRRLALAA